MDITEFGRDVYEWENGRVFLISSGSSTQNSIFLDSSESGGDVFFATTSELVAGDNDGAYDIYDARVPRPGDNPRVAVPCQGEVCQGPPSVPQLLSAPSSATFSGLGNISPQPQPASESKPRRLRSPKKKRKKGKAKLKRKRGKSEPGGKARRAAVGVARGGYGRGGGR